MPLLPALILGTMIATACAAAFHLAFGKTGGELVRFWMAAMLGFWLAQFAANLVSSPLPTVGEVRPVEGLVASTVALVLVRRTGQLQARL